MERSRFQQIRRLFLRAEAIPEHRRQSFLEDACGDDVALREEVERLLKELDHSTIEAVLEQLQQAANQIEEVPTELFAPGQEIGGCLIVERVGSGGMGVVFRATQQSTGQSVAVKVLKSERSSSEARIRFDLEVEAYSRLNHPAIARILDADKLTELDYQLSYLVTEFIDGSSWATHLSERRLDLRAKIELFLAVCDGIQHAHGQGIIHRDIKPGNILVAKTGHPKIIDFGVARFLQPSDVTRLETLTGQLLGTLQYMSPEQVAGNAREVDIRTDIYALGLVLFESLCNEVPYEVAGKPIQEATHVITEQEPRRLAEIDRSLRGDLELIVAKSLAKEKDRRYQTVAEFAADLRHFLANEPISARAPTISYRFAKFAKRRPGSLVALASVIVAVGNGRHCVRHQLSLNTTSCHQHEQDAHRIEPPKRRTSAPHRRMGCRLTGLRRG